MNAPAFHRRLVMLALPGVLILLSAGAATGQDAPVAAAPEVAGSTTVVLDAVADTFVNAADPKKNYGSRSDLKVALGDGSLLSVWYEKMADSPRAVLRQARWTLQG